MKTFLACLVSVAAATGANYFILKHELSAANAAPKEKSDEQIVEQLGSINNGIDSLNEHLLNARSDSMRIYHFVAGHRSYSKRGPGGALYCPECGLIVDLENRQTMLDNKIAELSERLANLKKENQAESQEFKDGVAEIQRMETERGLLQKHLFARADMEKKLSATTNTPAEFPPSQQPAADDHKEPDQDPGKADKIDEEKK